jgi:nucleotide-binding universal stress UspA family protein
MPSQSARTVRPARGVCAYGPGLGWDRQGESAVEMEVTVSQEVDPGRGVPRQVLVPLDGSRTGARAMPLAHALAGRTGAELVTLHVGEAADPELRVDVELSGTPAEALLAFAQEEPGRMVCLSSHGRGGLRRALLGSVAEQVVRAARVPVVVVGPNVEIRPPIVLPRTIVVAVRSDEHGVAALAERWAPLLGSRIERIHVAVADDEAFPPPEGARVIPGDDPAEVLLDLANELPGPLLYAVGAPAPDGSRSGRPVAFRLMRHARWPVLTRSIPSG